MGWWITLGILILLAVLPLGVRIRYDSDGFFLRVLAGPLGLTVFPIPSWMKRKSGNTKKTGKKTEEKRQEKKTVPDTPKEKKGGSITRFLPLVKTGLDFLNDFRRKLCLNHLQVRIVLGGGDPSDLAVNYGRTWAAVGNLLPRLEKIFVIQKREIEITCDFKASETLLTLGMDIIITLGRVVGLLVIYGIRILKEFLKLKKNKAVQVNESEAS